MRIHKNVRDCPFCNRVNTQTTLSDYFSVFILQNPKSKSCGLIRNEDFGQAVCAPFGEFPFYCEMQQTLNITQFVIAVS